MASKVYAFELCDDQTVKKQSVTLTFPRPNDTRLYIITNQKSNCYFLQDPKEQQHFQKTLGTGKISEEKKLFQYGVSTKVFSVTDPTGTKWEVRLLLSPSEITRLSSAFNLIGYLITHLVCRESRQALEELNGKNGSEVAKEIFREIAPFFSISLESDKVEDFCTQLRKIVIESCKDLCGEVALMVAWGLAALVAAEMAASLVGSDMFDYTGEKTQSRKNQKDQIYEIMAAFDVQAEQLAVKHQEKTMRIIFRNPCPDNWASGGRINADSGEMFEFGLCHKIFSICEAQYEIQFLQSLQESYNMVTLFHISAFAERLLMAKKWRKTLDILLKESQKEMIDELSQLAATFVCGNKCDPKIFQNSFRKEMRDKCLKVKTLQGDDEMIGVFGILVAITAALKAISVADNHTGDLDLSSDEDTEQLAVSVDIDGGMRGEADGLRDEDIEGYVALEHQHTRTSPHYPHDASHPCDGDNQESIIVETSGALSTSGALEPSTGLLPTVEPQDMAKITTILGTCKEDREDPDKVNSDCSHVVDTVSGSRTSQISNLKSSDKNRQKVVNQHTPNTDGGESFTFESPHDPSQEKSQGIREFEVDQVGQMQDHPLDIDPMREDTTNREGATSLLPILLAIMVMVLAVASFMVPSRLMTVLFTGFALIVGLVLFLSRRPNVF